MIFENEFSVPSTVDEAWTLLLDVERVAPCMPGATLDSIDGDEFTGRIRVKIGAIQMTYKMKGRFIERDKENWRVVIEGSGKENRGTGTVKATITLTMIPRGDTTDVRVGTDLAITGKPAQFGRGVLDDIGSKIVGQFAKNLAAALDEDKSAPTPAEFAAPTTAQPTPTVAPVRPAPDNEPLDLVGVLAPSRERMITIGLAALLAIVTALFLSRPRRQS
ncbi:MULTISPECIES: SRPBCC family protein [Rhodococcus]|uniref:SRPBCC family protein n=1 Tax=Rhodococcus TaxID=1827 RepID=UPI00102140CF|nr:MULTISPECIES: SRPBCC family protein [Rhodococcus]UTT48489.1 SRPBCC family protein [Rhodococcus gordoniae]